MTGTKWARVLVGLSSALLFALGTAAVKALGTAAVKALAIITIAVDPNDPALINLRAKAVKDMLDANLPSVMHALIENAHQKSVMNDPVLRNGRRHRRGWGCTFWPARIQARLNSGASGARRAAVEVELKKSRASSPTSLRCWRCRQTVDEVEVMNCLTLVLETYRQVASDEHKDERHWGFTGNACSRNSRPF